jgi:hypothetical protein
LKYTVVAEWRPVSMQIPHSPVHHPPRGELPPELEARGDEIDVIAVDGLARGGPFCQERLQAEVPLLDQAEPIGDGQVAEVARVVTGGARRVGGDEGDHEQQLQPLVQRQVEDMRPPPSHTMMHFQMVSAKVARQPAARVYQCFLCHQTTSWNDIKGVGWYKHH